MPFLSSFLATRQTCGGFSPLKYAFSFFFSSSQADLVGIFASLVCFFPLLFQQPDRLDGSFLLLGMLFPSPLPAARQTYLGFSPLWYAFSFSSSSSQTDLLGIFVSLVCFFLLLFCQPGRLAEVFRLFGMLFPSPLPPARQTYLGFSPLRYAFSFSSSASQTDLLGIFASLVCFFPLLFRRPDRLDGGFRLFGMLFPSFVPLSQADLVNKFLFCVCP